jgi:hypothetical protein
VSNCQRAVFRWGPSTIQNLSIKGPDPPSLTSIVCPPLSKADIGNSTDILPPADFLLLGLMTDLPFLSTETDPSVLLLGTDSVLRGLSSTDGDHDGYETWLVLSSKGRGT